MSEQFVLTRPEIDELADKLDVIASDHLAMEMAIALTGQASTGSSGGTSRPQPGSREPYSLHIEQLIDDLANELSTTIRHLEEHRPGLRYDGNDTIKAAAMWLHRMRFAIALLEDAVEIHHGLIKVIDRCMRSVNVGERAHIIDDRRVQAANRQILTAGQVEKLAHKLAPEYRRLNKRRVESLRSRHGLLGTRDPDTGVWFYRLGDVLAADKQARERRAELKHA